jgi:hypothetical protein
MLRIPGKVVFIIDALDEHPAPPDELLGLLASLNHRLHLRLLVTIRDEPDIRTAMKGIGAIEFDLGKAPEQKELIHKYITRVVESDEPLQSWTDSQIQLVKKKVLQESVFVISLPYYSLCC